MRALNTFACFVLAVLALSAFGAEIARAQFFNDSVFQRRQAPQQRPGFPAPPAPRGGFAAPRTAQPPGFGRPQPGRPQQAAVQPAQPQQRRCFFCNLFGGGGDKPSGWPFGSTAPVEVEKPKPPTAARPARVRPAVEVTTFVTVMGDNIADHLGVGLADAFEDRPEVGVKRRIRAAAGLVRNEDYEYWTKAAAEVAATEKLNYVVFELGSKDLVPFKEGDIEIPPLSEEWKRRYAERVDAVLAPFRDKKVKVFWVGLPPVKNEALSADLVAINGILKERAQFAGAKFIDVWEAFLDENNAYTQVGPDLAGQVVRLRLNDGVAFTRAGSRKLAHYVEREIRRDLEGKGADPLLIPGIASNEIGKVRPDAGPLIVLTAPVKSPNGELLGATPAVAAPEAIARVLVRGEPVEPLPGRMDDLDWRPRPPAPPVAEAPAVSQAPGPGAALAPPVPAAGVSGAASSRP